VKLLLVVHPHEAVHPLAVVGEHVAVEQIVTDATVESAGAEFERFHRIEVEAERTRAGRDGKVLPVPLPHREVLGVERVAVLAERDLVPPVFVEVMDVIFLGIRTDDDELDRVTLVGLPDVVAAAWVAVDPRAVERSLRPLHLAHAFAGPFGAVVDRV
jgi:hypothetical protein